MSQAAGPPRGREHRPSPAQSLTLARSLRVPPDALVHGRGCEAPGRHVLVCAVEVQDEAGQQTWGQDSVLTAAAFPPSSVWDLQAGGCGAGSFGATWPLPGCVLARKTLKTNNRGPAEKEGSRPGGAGRGQANKLLIEVGEGRRKNDRALGDPREWGSLPWGPGHPPVL